MISGQPGRVAERWHFGIAGSSFSRSKKSHRNRPSEEALPAARNAAPMQLFPALNQPPHLQDYNAYQQDPVLTQWLSDSANLIELGHKVGEPEWQERGVLANQYGPTLKAFSRQGERIDEVSFHPAWHELMALGMKHGVHCLPWEEGAGARAHQERVGAHYLLTQLEAGVGCPLTMTFAAVPSLRRQPEVAEQWVPRLVSREYDFGLKLPETKKSCLMGMAMTEKQGGSDVRANTTQAEPLSDGTFRLIGHKFFCSAPMSDAFLTLAQRPAGVTCFLVPRVLPDGTRNRIHIQRLKDKLGNRSNASSEIEYHGAIAWKVGEEGRGVPTIIEMVNHTRLDCVVCSTSLMRAALVQALHHCRSRLAFGRLLSEQPLMVNVLADLSLEWEAALLLMMRLAQGFDSKSPEESAWVRLVTAIAKYWVCKRGAAFAQECMECLGGSGYVEESVLPRIYREMPLTSIWEGSGNVICLDVLRAVHKTPSVLDLFWERLQPAAAEHPRLGAAVAELKQDWQGSEAAEVRSRSLVERMALCTQAALLIEHSPAEVAQAFMESRLGPGLRQWGTLPASTPWSKLLERAWR
jgi:putative acyl-CoA dehydrogenase